MESFEDEPNSNDFAFVPEDDNMKKITEIRMSLSGDVNILLLSETGVGKSTFINAVANYLTYGFFEIAEIENLRVLIPAQIQIEDKDKKRHQISVGATDKNEFLKAGESATQDVKSYIFLLNENQGSIRLIDTPGMGDTRGPEQDSINCDYILNYIGGLEKLHAICCLFKPSNTRNTIYFQYCITEILSRLDRSASRNIVFVFTHTRGSDYSSGDTYDILRTTLDSIKNRNQVNIPLEKNIFCFDNEAFRYLAALQKGVRFDERIRGKYKESWETSNERFWEMIKYIKDIEPHMVQNTNAVNEARRIITHLAQPLADIAELINDNLEALQRHQQRLNDENITLEQLKNEMYMPIIDLKVVELDQPTTVCTSTGCAEVYKIGDKNKWHYKQRCHDPCHLTNVQADTVNNEAIFHCWAIDRSTKNCKQCGCHYLVHMHIYYTSTTVESNVENSNVLKNIDSSEKLMAEVQNLVDEIVIRREELEFEQDLIVTSCAKFSHFLQKNAITPFNDRYKDYIEYLISREKALGAVYSKKSVQHLQKMLQKYEATKKMFDRAVQMKDNLNNSQQEVTAKDIQKTVQDLYNLKNFGKKIKELYDRQQLSRKKERQNTEEIFRLPQKNKNTQRGNKKIEGKNKGVVQKLANKIKSFSLNSNVPNSAKGMKENQIQQGTFKNVQRIATDSEGPNNSIHNRRSTDSGNDSSGWNNNFRDKNQNVYHQYDQRRDYDSPSRSGTFDRYHNPSDYYDSSRGRNDVLPDRYGASFGRNSAPSDRYETQFDRYDPPRDNYEATFGRYEVPSNRYNASLGRYDAPSYENPVDRYGPPPDRYDSSFRRNFPPLNRYDSQSGRYGTASDRYENSYDPYEQPRNIYDARFEERETRRDRNQTSFVTRGRNDEQRERNEIQFSRYSAPRNLNDDSFGGRDEQRGRKEAQFDRYETARDRNEATFGANEDQRGRNEDRNETKFGGNEEQHDSNQDQFDRYETPRDRNEVTFGGNKDPRDGNQAQFGRNEALRNRNHNKFGANEDQRDHNQGQFRRYEAPRDRHENKFGGNEEQCNRIQGQFGRYASSRDRNATIFGVNEDQRDHNQAQFDRYERPRDLNETTFRRNQDQRDRNQDQFGRYEAPRDRNENSFGGREDQRDRYHDQFGRSDATFGGNNDQRDRNRAQFGRYGAPQDRNYATFGGNKNQLDRNETQFSRYGAPKDRNDASLGDNGDQRDRGKEIRYGAPQEHSQRVKEFAGTDTSMDEKDNPYDRDYSSNDQSKAYQDYSGKKSQQR